jgi:hypothetical protein
MLRLVKVFLHEGAIKALHRVRHSTNNTERSATCIVLAGCKNPQRARELVRVAEVKGADREPDPATNTSVRKLTKAASGVGREEGIGPKIGERRSFTIRSCRRVQWGKKTLFLLCKLGLLSEGNLGPFLKRPTLRPFLVREM